MQLQIDMICDGENKQWCWLIRKQEGSPVLGRQKHSCKTFASEPRVPNLQLSCIPKPSL